jgi:nucleotide-binding universal stress UspA family protein
MSLLSKVLFAVELSESTEKMHEVMSDLVRAGVRHITLLHVIDARDIHADPQTVAYSVASAQGVLDHWKEAIASAGIPSVETQVVVGTPWIEINRIAEEDKFSFVLLGSHGGGLISTMFLGDQTENVLHHGTKPLLIIRLRISSSDQEKVCDLSCARVFRKILYATDFSDDAKNAIPFVEEMARASPESLVIAHIQDLRTLRYATDAQMTEFNRKDSERLEDLAGNFKRFPFREIHTVLKTGNAISEILEIARTEDASLIVLGAKGKTHLAEMLLGGVSETVVHQSKAHVFIVRHYVAE